MIVIALIVLIAEAAAGHSSTVHMLDVPPRYMWGWSPPAPASASGYCGSASVQTAGIYYGNWFTQDYVRGTSGGHDADHSLLLGVQGNTSVLHACMQLKLNCTGWASDEVSKPQYRAFLNWAIGAIDEGWPVIIGVFESELTDSDYDHIVPMVGYDDTAIYINDLQQNTTLRYKETEFVRDRKTCHGKESPEWCLPKWVDYGVQVHGNVDANGVLLPIRMAVSSWGEPDYSREDRVHQKPVELLAHLKIMGLDVGSRYALLQYDDPTKVPDKDFLTSDFDHKTLFTASRSIHRHSITFMSNSYGSLQMRISCRGFDGVVQ